MNRQRHTDRIEAVNERLRDEMDAHTLQTEGPAAFAFAAAPIGSLWPGGPSAMFGMTPLELKAVMG